jgi:hypothetical protein
MQRRGIRSRSGHRLYWGDTVSGAPLLRATRALLSQGWFDAIRPWRNEPADSPSPMGSFARVACPSRPDTLAHIGANFLPDAACGQRIAWSGPREPNSDDAIHRPCTRCTHSDLLYPQKRPQLRPQATFAPMQKLLYSPSEPENVARLQVSIQRGTRMAARPS